MQVTERYERLMELAGELSDLASANAILGWDQETLMPEKGIGGRAQVSATLAALHHEKLTATELTEHLEGLKDTNGELDEQKRAQVRELHRIQTRACRVPESLVRRLAETRSQATAVWAKARGDKDFASFAPMLNEIMGLTREMADALADGGNPYDALMEEYEPGADVQGIATAFDEVKEFLIPFIRQIQDSGIKPDMKSVLGPYDTSRQDAFCHEVVKAMGFDLDAGRIDTSNHPFCSGIHPGDVRLTTRFKDDLRVGLLGCMHEAGHGMYEQGTMAAFPRTPLGSANSLGVHESQSRLWENNVGLGKPFWTHFYPKLQAAFPEHTGGVDLDTFYAAMNDVQASFIRIEADEVTYNLHVGLRFEIERELIENKFPVDKLPELWNEKFQTYFGITPPSDDVGVLQDIHWAAGLVGYFPTYMLGSLRAAQFYASAEQAMPDLSQRIAAGQMLPLRDWLRENVHNWGSWLLPEDLMRKATGRITEAKDFTAYMQAKYAPLYKL